MCVRTQHPRTVRRLLYCCMAAACHLIGATSVHGLGGHLRFRVGRHLGATAAATAKEQAPPAVEARAAPAAPAQEGRLKRGSSGGEAGEERGRRALAGAPVTRPASPGRRGGRRRRQAGEEGKAEEGWGAEGPAAAAAAAAQPEQPAASRPASLTRRRKGRQQPQPQQQPLPQQRLQRGPAQPLAGRGGEAGPASGECGSESTWHFLQAFAGGTAFVATQVHPLLPAPLGLRGLV